MKLRKTTWILLALAIFGGGFVYFYTIIETNQPTAIERKQQKLFSFSREDIQELSIKTPKRTIQFEATGNPTTPWRMRQPETTLASEATVSFLVNLLVDGKTEKTFTVPVEQKKEYGFDNPQAMITIRLKDQQSHQMILGKTDYEDKFLYAQIDPMDSQALQVSLVDKSFQYALDRDLAEWKQTL